MDFENSPVQEPPKNLKQRFEKELAAEPRKELAEKLRGARKLPKKLKEVFKHPEGITPEFKPSVDKKIEKAKRDIIGRIFNTYEFKELEKDIEGYLKEQPEWHMKRARNDYKEKLDESLANSPLTPEEQDEFLSEEAMTGMDLDDYLALTRRLSGNFITHVTRFGVRENTFMYHSVGEGEFFDTFPRLLEQKKLSSFFATFIDDPESFKIVRDYTEYCIKEKNMHGQELADHIASFYSQENMAADREGPHFAVNNVAASSYGGEKGYDIFFYYPAEFIAHNYKHNARQGKEFQYKDSGVTVGGYDSYNDMVVLPRDGGIPIDAGITFIPGALQVDRATGSQYKIKDGKPELGENGNMLLAEDTISSEEYWKKYFEQNPKHQPNKIIYYGSYANFQPIKTRPLNLGEVEKSYGDLYKKNEFHSEDQFTPEEIEDRKKLYADFRDAVTKFTSSIEAEVTPR